MPETEKQRIEREITFLENLPKVIANYKKKYPYICKVCGYGSNVDINGKDTNHPDSSGPIMHKTMKHLFWCPTPKKK